MKNPMDFYRDGLDRFTYDPKFHRRVYLAVRVAEDLAGPTWPGGIPTKGLVAAILAAGDQPILGATLSPDGPPSRADLEAIGRRYSAALDAKPGKGPITHLDRLIDSVADIPALLAELEDYRRKEGTR